ncbi:MAG: sulfite exporter TauE/SafE family protein [Candidatus Aenigmarchaeota archaeon]|nr:sulfite exporter TauE/SafE family protein [Candidatus Aenigmarchaeota archaeon]
MFEIFLLIFGIGVATGFFDSLVGAGGLISIPSLIFLGIPPQTAIATDRFGTIGQTLSALYKFWKAKGIVWKYVPILSILALAGSLIGSIILLNVDTKILESVIVILVLVLVPLVLLKRSFGVKSVKTSKFKNIIGLFLYFLIMIFAGFFGQGTGPMTSYVVIFFLGFTMIENLGTGIIPWFVLSISSVIIFAFNGIIDYQIGIVLLVGMAIGGYLGAHIAIKKGNVWVKRLFVLFVVVLSVKLLLFN